MQILRSKRVWYANGFRPADVVLGEDGKIAEVLPYGTAEKALAERKLSAEKAATDHGKKCPASEAENADAVVVEDFKSMRLLPGFIDVHTHGAYGYDTNDADPEGLRMWMRRIPEEGVTALLPTTVTQFADILKKAVASVADVAESAYDGAEILGIHLEGPFFDMAYKGAQPPEAILPASVGLFQEFQEAARGWIKYISLAPEHDENYALTRYCAQHGVVVSMGHSGASLDQALLCVANGATSETHVCNGMSQLLHRMPGLVGAALRIRDIYGEMICDTQHVNRDVMNIYFNTKGRDYAMMVSDSLRCKHADPGQRFTLGGHPIHLDELGLARLEDNTIAGSTLRLNQGLKNLIETCEIPVDYAINACTINPARCLGVDDRKGRICAGYDADLVLLDDAYNVVQTYCRGKKMLN